MSPRSVGEVRPSQLITTFGPGAVVDLPRLSAIVAGGDTWTIREELRVDEPRLCSALRVRELYQPLVEQGRRGPFGTVPAHVFPRVLVCPVCRRLAPVEQFRWDPRWAEFRCTEPRCEGRGEVRAIPSRFVVACKRGHLDDFPFHDYVHGGSSGGCAGPLRLFDSGETGSISDIAVYCVGRRERRTLGAAFADSSILGGCTRRRPWLGPDDRDPTDCDETPWAILRGASNLYFAIVRSALSVPPWADPINDAIARYERMFANVQTLSDLQTLLRIGNFPELVEYSAEEVFESLQRRRQPIPTLEVGALLQPEWQALRNPTRSSGRTDFETERVDVPEGFENHLAQVVLVHRLKEVRALQGFTRIEPPGSWGDEPDDPTRIAPIFRERRDWLPAIVVRGEGVFIELRHETVDTWASRPAVSASLSRMSAALMEWRVARGLEAGAGVDPRLVLAHSLAHLLIRRMSLDAGYSASSLRERVYGSTMQGMSGLLIYTATPDSDGSLGGLVDLGRPSRLRSLLRDALQEAQLCSSDPLCSDNEPRVKGMLNGAACHACLLASETSCERSNRLLDRALIVPTLSARGAEYFENPP